MVRHPKGRQEGARPEAFVHQRPPAHGDAEATLGGGKDLFLGFQPQRPRQNRLQRRTSDAVGSGLSSRGWRTLRCVG